MINESQWCMMMHALGFQSNGKGKFYRNFYSTSAYTCEYNLFKELEDFGYAEEKNMSHLGIEGFFKLTQNGIYATLQRVSNLKKIKNCMTCKHLEYVQGEVTDPSGNCCNKRYYKDGKEESKHLAQLDDYIYLFKSKKCWEG